METKRIALGDVELAYNEVAGSGRAFVLLHGLTGHRDDFRPCMPELAEFGRALAPDLRGHGDFTQTGRAETFTFPQFIADTVALLDAWGIDHCHLLGHSFGGMLALRLVLDYPDRVDSLILMDTAPFSPEAYEREMFETGSAIVKERGMGFLQEAVEKATKQRDEPSAADRHLEDWGGDYWPHHRLRYMAMDPVAYMTLVFAMVDQQPVVSCLDEIRCPTTVLVGSDDGDFLKGADALHAGIPNAERVTIPDAGHHPHRENPDVWLAAVRGHFARLDRGSAPG